MERVPKDWPMDFKMTITGVPLVSTAWPYGADGHASLTVRDPATGAEIAEIVEKLVI